MILLSLHYNLLMGNDNIKKNIFYLKDFLLKKFHFHIYLEYKKQFLNVIIVKYQNVYKNYI